MKNETKTNSSLLITGIVALIVGALGFFGGMKYQQSQTRSMFGFQNGSGRAGAGGNTTVMMGRGANGLNRPVTGEIINSDDKSITVKMQDGSSKIVLINNTTTIDKAQEVSKTELTAGAKVAVFGTNNSDGSVTAISVQLNPQERMFGGQGKQGTPAATPNQ